MQCEYCQNVHLGSGDIIPYNPAAARLPEGSGCKHMEANEDWYELAQATLCPGFTSLSCPRHPEELVHARYGCGVCGRRVWRPE